MIDNNLGRTWKNAPSGVRDARTLAWLGAVFSGIIVIIMLVLFVKQGAQGILGSSAFLLIYVVFFPLYVWLLLGLKRGTKGAYYVQMIVSIIGLIGFPVGTLINGYILYKWFRPETKAWFGV